MKHDALSMRQMMVLLAVALLAPATDVLPALAVQWAGRGGWLIPAGVFPLLLLALWAASGLCLRGGLSQTLGRAPAGFVAAVYLAWVLLTLTLSLRLCWARLAAFDQSGPAVCVVFLLAVAVWMGLGKVSAFARAGEVFYLALAVALIAVFLLAAPKVEWENLRPTLEEAAGLPGGCAAAAGLLLNIVPACALGGRVAKRPGNVRRAVGWTAAFCVTAALLLASITGCLGAGLTARLPEPFLIMIQGLGVKGAFQRTEALFAALWTLSDLILAGLLLHAWRALAGELCPGKWGRWSVVPVAAAALAGGWLFFPEAEQVQRFCGTVLPVAGIVLGLALPLLLQICVKRKILKNPEKSA